MTSAAALVDARLLFGHTVALDGMGFEVRQGEMFGLVGPDGAGKTTAIRALLGLLPLKSGAARVLGLDPIAEAARVKREVGYLSQRFTLYGDLSVEENIRFFGEIHSAPGLDERLDHLLAFTRLGPFRDRRADRLSGGMQKKLALACTLIHTPKVLFLDEPTTGVDPVSRREFWGLLSKLLLDGIAILLSTPYLDEAERCSRVALVRAGRTLACATPAELRATWREELIEITCHPARRARDLLVGNPRVRKVQLFGDRLHVVPNRPGDTLEDLVRAADDVTLIGVRPVLPSLEDVFIELVGEAAGGSGRA